MGVAGFEVLEIHECDLYNRCGTYIVYMSSSSCYHDVGSFFGGMLDPIPESVAP